MRDGWREVRLGDILRRSTDRLGSAEEPPILTVTEGNGLVDQVEHWGRRIATEDVAKYKVVRPHAIVYNVYLLWLGAVGRNTLGEHAITSPVYEVFDVDSTAEPRFVEHLLRSETMRAAYAGISIGSVPRRRRTPWQDFLKLTVSLPPLSEQRRIVDLIGSVDDAIKTAETEADRSWQLLEAVLDAQSEDRLEAVGALAHIGSGASWSKSDLRSSTEEASTVMTIANTKPDGSVSGEPTYVAGLGSSNGRLTASSIVVVRTNGNRGRIGNAYRVPDRFVGAAVSAFQLILEPNDQEESDYLYWMLRRSRFQDAVSAAASGSTGLGNIAASKLRAMKVPWPASAASRVEKAITFQTLADAVKAAQSTTESLRKLRSNLLSALLSGEHEIPSVYDKLLNPDEEEA